MSIRSTTNGSGGVRASGTMVLARRGVWLCCAVLAALQAPADIIEAARNQRPVGVESALASAAFTLCARSASRDMAGELVPCNASPYLDTDRLLRREDAVAPSEIPAASAGTFLVAYDGLHPKLEMFDGSSYQGLMVMFRPQKARSTSTSLLYDIETGEMLVKAVASVKPLPEPAGALMQPVTSPATMGGGLLLFCLLGYRRRSVVSLEIVPADAFNLPEPKIHSKAPPVQVTFKVVSNIYNRVLKVSNWAATPFNLLPEPPYARAPSKAEVPAFSVFGLKRKPKPCRVHGGAAQLFYASRISLLLMRTSGRS